MPGNPTDTTKRNANIEEQLFSVWKEPVYLGNSSKPIPGFKAIVGAPSGDTKTVFSIVSDSYLLVTNKEALDFGKQIHLKLFPDAHDNSFEIFNIITPTTKSYCHIDIIEKNYKLNVWNKEVYVPFIRVHNSYNKTRSLKFDIGFCRQLCNNGVIFEQDTITLKFAHTKKSMDPQQLDKVNVDRLKSLEKDFINKTKKSTEIAIPRRLFKALAAKTLNKSFNIHEKNLKKRAAIAEKMKEFSDSIIDYTDQYIQQEEMGETAYAFYNVITHYASNNNQSAVNSRNSLQRKCGLWISQVGNLVKRTGFNWDHEIKGFEYLI